MVTSCRQVEEWIEQALAGTLTPHQERAFHRHLQECCRCRQRYEREKRAVAGLQSLERVEPPADFASRVMAALPAVSPKLLSQVAAVLRQAEGDLELRRRLRENPRSALLSMRVALPPSLRVEVTSAQPAPLPTAETFYLPLPEVPLRLEEQEQRLAAMGLGALFGFWW